MTDRDARPVRKKIRLDPEAYAAPGTTISVTIATAGRRPVFADPSCTQRCLDVLQKISSDNEINIIVYCFMPDHLHLLLENTRGTDIPGFMRQFKSWTTRIAWQHDWHGALWQRSYHDHVLREYEDTSSYIRYILGNPVQADLVQTWNEYPWSGSFIYDFSNPADWPTKGPAPHANSQHTRNVGAGAPAGPGFGASGLPPDAVRSHRGVGPYIGNTPGRCGPTWACDPTSGDTTGTRSADPCPRTTMPDILRNGLDSM